MLHLLRDIITYILKVSIPCVIDVIATSSRTASPDNDMQNIKRFRNICKLLMKLNHFLLFHPHPLMQFPASPKYRLPLRVT